MSTGFSKTRSDGDPGGADVGTASAWECTSPQLYFCAVFTFFGFLFSRPRLSFDMQAVCHAFCHEPSACQI